MPYRPGGISIIHLVAANAPREKTDRSLASWAIDIVSPWNEKVALWNPTCWPIRFEEIETSFFILCLFKILVTVFLRSIAVPDGASSLSLWWISSIDIWVCCCGWSTVQELKALLVFDTVVAAVESTRYGNLLAGAPLRNPGVFEVSWGILEYLQSLLKAPSRVSKVFWGI